MWERTKRLINSYLDNMIEKASSPDKDVRAMTRAEIGRLNEVEIQAAASAKMFEKELAEVNLKLLGLGERERIMREQGNESSALRAREAIDALSAQRDLLQQQIREASASVSKARSLREQRKVQGEELASETIMTQMRENIAGVHSGFDVTDPASTIDEMRSRLNASPYSSPYSSIDARVAEADLEMEEQKKKAGVDDLLSRYKSQLDSPVDPPVEVRPPSIASTNISEEAPVKQADEEKPEEKSLGRSEGNIRPID